MSASELSTGELSPIDISNNSSLFSDRERPFTSFIIFCCILGLCIFVYGIFEYTSAAIFKDWEPIALFVDTLWGGILYLSVYSIYKEIKKIL